MAAAVKSGFEWSARSVIEGNIDIEPDDLRNYAKMRALTIEFRMRPSLQRFVLLKQLERLSEEFDTTIGRYRQEYYRADRRGDKTQLNKLLINIFDLEAAVDRLAKPAMSEIIKPVIAKTQLSFDLNNAHDSAPIYVRSTTYSL